MTIVNPVPAIGAYVPPFMPLDNITPFTYRDGMTYLQILHELKRYINLTLVPFVDTEFTSLGTEFATQVSLLLDTVNANIAELTTNVDAAIATEKTYVDTQIANIITSTIAVTDPVTLAIFNNLATNTRIAMDAQYGTKRNQNAIAVVVPAGSTAAQAQAILTAAPSGSIITWEPGSDQLAPVGGFTLSNDNIVIDLRNARITQAAQSAPAFDLISRNGITVRNGTIEFTGVPGTIAGNIRGSAAYVSSAAVWANGDNIKVLATRIKNFVCGAFFSSWDGANLNGKYSNYNTFEGNEVSGHNFGVLYTAQNHFVVKFNKFHDDVDGSAGVNPTHSIYGSSTTGVRSTDVQWIGNKTYNHLHGQAYQGKYEDRLVIRNCTADTVSGLANFIDCHDLDIDGMRSTDDIGFGTAGSFSMQSTDLVSQRPRVRNIDINYRDSINSRPFLFIGQDGKFDRCTTRINPSATYNGALFDVRGDNMELFNCDGTNANPAVTVIGVLINVGPTATNAVVRGGKFKNVTNVVQLGAGTNGAKVNLDNTVQTYTGLLISAPAGVDYGTKDVVPVALSTLGEHATLFGLAKDTVTHPAANQGVQVKVRPTRDIQVSNLYWYCVTASGNYDIGIYDDASNVPLFTKGTTPAPAAGLVNVAVAPATPAVMRAGRVYRLTIAADNNVLQYRGLTAPVAGMDMLLAGGNNATQVAAIFPLPTATLVAGATTVAGIPLIIVAGTRPA